MTGEYHPLNVLRHHVTGAVERGEAEPIVERRACEWYALCRNEAVGMVSHPILGDVPVCQRCADKHGMVMS